MSVDLAPTVAADPPKAGRRALPEPAVVSLVVAASAVLYAWHLSAVGWMNQYYAAVAQSGAASWRAWFFGSPDITGVTTTDKPPLAFWPMGLSVRVFGLHPWSVALPQVLETLVTVVVLYLTVRHLGGRVAATVAAAVFATTPVVVVLARFDDPDTLLTLLVTVAAYATVRALRSPHRSWLVLLGVSVGLAFLTKWLAALLPVPALLAALVRSRQDGPARWWSWRWWLGGDAGRALRVVAASALVSGMWWVVVFALIPSSTRPAPDTPKGNVLGLILGQNGFSRLEPASGSTVSPLTGDAGVLRLVEAPFGGQIGWFLPAAVIVLLLALRSARGLTHLPAGHLVFGGWLLLAGGVFSLMGGAMHPYYTDLLAPAVAALVGLGAADLARAGAPFTGRWRGRVAVVALVAGLGWYAVTVVAVLPSAAVWSGLVVVGLLVALGATVGTWRSSSVRRRAALRVVAAATTAAALLLGPTAFAASTLSHPVQGANPLAGPTETGDGHAEFTGALVSFLRAHHVGAVRWAAAVATSTPASTLQLQTGLPVLPLGGFTGHSGYPQPGQLEALVRSGQLRYIVLAGPYTSPRPITPRGLIGTPTARAMTWAMAHGCRLTLPGGHYAVLDLAPGAACHAQGR